MHTNGINSILFEIKIPAFYPELYVPLMIFFHWFKRIEKWVFSQYTLIWWIWKKSLGSVHFIQRIFSLYCIIILVVTEHKMCHFSTGKTAVSHMASPLHHCIWLTAQLWPQPPSSPTNRFPGNLNQMGIQREAKPKKFVLLKKKNTLFFYMSNVPISITGYVLFSGQQWEIFSSVPLIIFKMKISVNSINYERRGKMNLGNH